MSTFPGPVVPGGGGRAKGFGGPDAPALINALAEGDGGGRTTAEWPPSLAGVKAEFLTLLGDEPAVPLPASEFSLGI